MAFLPRVMRSIREGKMRLVGSGENLLNIVYISDVAAMAILAATHEQAGGKAYNCCTRGDMTQRELIDSLCNLMSVPPVRRRVSYRLAHYAAMASEVAGRARGKTATPRLTRHALSVFLRPVHFSSARAESELGWCPQVSTPDGVHRTARWLRTVAPEPFQVSTNNERV
jgi:nucleoside-diphosphate-sugar epimerase